MCRGGRYSFPGLLYFTLDPYLIMLSVKQGGIKSLWYDSTWDWTQVSRAIGEHSIEMGAFGSPSTMVANFTLLTLYICSCVCVCVCVFVIAYRPNTWKKISSIDSGQCSWNDNLYWFLSGSITLAFLDWAKNRCLKSVSVWLPTWFFGDRISLLHLFLSCWHPFDIIKRRKSIDMRLNENATNVVVHFTVN